MRAKMLLTVMLVTFVASAAFAGGKCTDNTQACLNNIAAKQTKGWLGTDGEKNAEPAGYRLTKVYADGPAAKAGLQVGDILVAMNGISYASTDEMKKAKQSLVPGSKATYTVVRDGKKQEVEVTLGQIPAPVLEASVGKHMLEHAEIQSASAQR
jgi:predicted metalloprotease with PDZ domain